MIGLLLALAAAIGYAAGLTVEQRALRRLPEISIRRPARLLVVLCSSPVWIAGFLVALFGLGCQTVALAYAPLTIVQPVFLAALTLLLMLGERLFGQRPSIRVWASLGCMVAALAMISASVGHGDDVGVRAATQVVVVVTLASALLGVVACLLAHRAAGGGSAVGVIYGSAAGLFYGIAGMQAKGVAGLFVRYHLRGVVPAMLRAPYPYLLALTCLLGLGLFQIALQRNRASIVVPVQNVVGNVYVVAVGSLLFHDRLPANPTLVALRIVGFALALVVLFVMPHRDVPAGERAGTEPAYAGRDA